MTLELVWDNARYQRCAAVEKVARSLRIELLFLPPYLQKLNLIERLWKFVKVGCLSCRDHKDFTRFKAAIMDCRDGVEGTHRGAMQSLMTLRFQTSRNTQILTA